MQTDRPAPNDEEIAAIGAALWLAARAQPLLRAPRMTIWRLAMRYPEIELEDLRNV